MVESTRLESERTGNRTVGSNPTLSAMPFVVPAGPGFRLRAQTPARCLKFESHPLRHSIYLLAFTAHGAYHGV